MVRIPQAAKWSFGLAIAILLLMRFVPSWITTDVRLLPTEGSQTWSFASTDAVVTDTAALDAGQPLDTTCSQPARLRCFQRVEELHRTIELDFSKGKTRKQTSISAHDTVQGSRTLLDLRDQASFVRHSAFPVDEAVASVESKSPLPGWTRAVHDEARTGLQYAFPFASEWRSYLYFDPFSHSSYPIDFVDKQDHNGTTIYRFEQHLAPALTGAYSIRGVAGQYFSDTELQQLGLRSSDAVTLNEYYAVQRSVWVEPRTGTIINMEEHPHSFLARNTDEAKQLAVTNERALFSAQFAFDEDTRDVQWQRASHGVHMLKLAHVIDYVSNLVALALLILGVLLARRAR